MSVSAIQNSGVCPSPEVQRAQPAAPPAESPVKEDRVVPEERAFDRYEPEDKSDTETCSTDRVDREIEQLKKRKEQLEQQLRSAAPDVVTHTRSPATSNPGAGPEGQRFLPSPARSFFLTTSPPG